jgi:hypothetical protein
MKSAGESARPAVPDDGLACRLAEAGFQLSEHDVEIIRADRASVKQRLQDLQSALVADFAADAEGVR